MSAAASNRLEERIAWYAVLALPAAVPLAYGGLPFGSATFAENPFIYPKIFVLALLVAVSASAWAWGVLRGTIIPRPVPGRWWLLAFMSLAAISAVFALDPVTAFFGGKYQRVGLMVMLLVAAAYVLVTQLVTSSDRLRALAWSTVGAGVVSAIVTVLESRGIDPLGLSRDNPAIFFRGPSLLGNPDFTANYLVVCVVLAAALAFSAREVRWRALAWACFGANLLAVVVSLTRGAWVGVAVGLGALLFVTVRSKATRKTAAYLAGALVLVLVVAVVVKGPSTFVARFKDLASAETAGDSRFVLWGEAIKVTRERPLLGTGPDGYSLGWYGARSPASMRISGMESVTDDPHNLLLLMVATLGIPAGLLGTGLLIAPLVVTARTALARELPPARLQYAGWWCALLGLLAAFVFAANVVVLTLMLGIAIGVLLAPRAKVALVASTGSKAMAGALASAAVVLLVISAMSLAADVRLRGGNRPVTSRRSILPCRLRRGMPRLSTWRRTPNRRMRQRPWSKGAPGAEQAASAADSRLVDLIDADPHDYASVALRAYFLAQIASVEGSATLERARDVAQDALDLYPLSPVAAYLKALAQADLGDIAGALDTLEPLWDVDPRYSDAGILYARLLAEKGERQTAVRVLDTLETRFPGNATILGIRQSLETSGTAQ